MRLAIIMGALALAGCTASSEMQASRQADANRELADALKGRVAGKPQDCVSTSLINGPQVIDDNTVLYRETGRVVWRNELRSSCPALDPFDTLIVEVHGSQICRNDRFRVLEAGSNIPSGYCMFGQFTPYTKQ